MAKTIGWGSYCVPQEQVNASGNNTNFYMDGDSGRKLSGDASYTITTYTAPVTVTSTTTLAADQDFVAIKALSIDSGNVHVSLDNGDSIPIKLLAGECFASKISDTARVRIVISDVAKVEYWSALTS